MNTPAATLLDKERTRSHRLRNFMQSTLLVAGIGGITAFGAWLVWGVAGIVGAFIAIALMLAFGPKASSELVMKMFRAKPLTAEQAPALHAAIATLARRAELPAVPRLYLVPSKILNAFAVGTPEKSSIAVTSGLLNTLPDRELIGVLAHELSHIRKNHLWVMGLADMMSRFTQVMSSMGLFFALYNGVLALFGASPVIPWSVALLLYMMPLASSLLQLALSRSREFDADLEAAQITGDPDGLSSALLRLERHQGRMWEDMLPSGRKIAIPSVLRSHPESDERVRRLSELKHTRPLTPSAGLAGAGHDMTLVLRPLPHSRHRTLPGVRL